LRLITEFDPWRDPLCTCPRKYSLSPYVGCRHSCAYCYITSYIPDGFRCREKARFLARLERDLARLRPGSLISISNSSDPYQPMEAERALTRSALERLLPMGLMVLLITNLVARDTELIERGNCSVSVSINCVKGDTFLSFSTCREGFPELGGAESCDGSHLIPLRVSAHLMDEFLD
jgi:DNA repair photolyase